MIDPWIRVSPEAPSIFDSDQPVVSRSVFDGDVVRAGVSLVSTSLTPAALPSTSDAQRLDPRFNVSWVTERARRFPFLLYAAGHPYAARCVARALEDAYFLNFRGAEQELALTPSIRARVTKETAPRGGAGPALKRVRAVALFLYNRPDLTASVFAAIRQARPERLFLLADGPKPNVPGDALLCQQARQSLIVDWDCQTFRDFSSENLGPRLRVETGFRFVFERVDEVIFLEDDLLPSPDFFHFCDALLEFHRDDLNVLSIGGTAAHFGLLEMGASYAFSRYPTSWGWATWKRAIAKYDAARAHPDHAVDTLSWLRQFLDSETAAIYWTRLFEPVSPRLSTWDYIWTRSSFLSGGLHAIPASNLVSNVGFRQDATHTRQSSPFANLPIEIVDFPLVHPRIERHVELDAFLEETVYSGNLTRALDRVRREVRERRARAVPFGFLTRA